MIPYCFLSFYSFSLFIFHLPFYLFFISLFVFMIILFIRGSIVEHFHELTPEGRGRTGSNKWPVTFHVTCLTVLEGRCEGEGQGGSLYTINQFTLILIPFQPCTSSSSLHPFTTPSPPHPVIPALLPIYIINSHLFLPSFLSPYTPLHSVTPSAHHHRPSFLALVLCHGAGRWSLQGRRSPARRDTRRGGLMVGIPGPHFTL